MYGSGDSVSVTGGDVSLPDTVIVDVMYTADGYTPRGDRSTDTDGNVAQDAIAAPPIAPPLTALG